jgi:hypothetical protein
VHDWLNQIITAKVLGIQALASREKVSASYVSKVIGCALLAPNIVRAIINGSQPAELNLEKLHCQFLGMSKVSTKALPQTEKVGPEMMLAENSPPNKWIFSESSTNRES